MSVLDLGHQIGRLVGAYAASAPVVDDRRLIREAIAGDAPARTRLAKRIRPVVHARVCQFLAGRRPARLGPDDCEDLIQLIWLRLTENQARILASFDPERGMSLEGYVGLIARRELFRRRRELSSQRRGGGAPCLELSETDHESASDRACAEQQMVDRERVDALVRKVCEQLPPRGKLIFAALYVDEQSVAETAQLLDIEVQVIYNWQHRIRLLARAHLASEQA